METIGTQELWSFIDGKSEATTARISKIRKGAGHTVNSFLELAFKVAELQFRNRDHVLLFRGQSADYRNKKGNSTLKPTLFRPLKKGNPNSNTLIQRFEALRDAEDDLAYRYQQAGFLGAERLQRQHILRWAILQHYEVCRTPLLDITASLRVAASFASLDHKGEAFLFVLGVPNLSGAITASAEAGLQIVRLSSVCPPKAIRPHLQEGYLLGEYPEMSDFGRVQQYFQYEIDFGRRLVAKFRFEPKTFWKDDAFPMVTKKALYPSPQGDPFHKVVSAVKQSISYLRE
jgi:hypothetical protein